MTAANVTKRRRPKSMVVTSRVRDAGDAVTVAVSFRQEDASATEAPGRVVADLSLFVIGRRLQQLVPGAVQEGC